jgi:hypothetical protein
MTFNINDNVKVRLTERGHEIMKARYDELVGDNLSFRRRYPYVKKQEDANGWSSFHLWDLMYIFGKDVISGSNPPFKMDILIDDKDLHEEGE